MLKIYILRLPVPVDVPYESNRLRPNNKLVFPKGFSVNLVLMIWGIAAALIIYGFLANFRDMLLKPTFEKTIDSAQDVVDNGLKVYTIDGGDWQKETMQGSTTEAWKTMGDMCYIPTSFEEYMSLTENELLAGTHAQVGIIFNSDRKLDIYHEAEEPVPGMVPYSVYIVNKKTPYMEEIQRTLAYMIQVIYIPLIFLQYINGVQNKT